MMAVWAIEDGTFPVLLTLSERQSGYPDRFPMESLEPHREQAERNHSQTLERLAARGGLAPAELYYACHGDNPWRRTSAEIDAAAPRIRTWLESQA